MSLSGLYSIPVPTPKKKQMAVVCTIEIKPSINYCCFWDHASELDDFRWSITTRTRTTSIVVQQYWNATRLPFEQDDNMHQIKIPLEMIWQETMGGLRGMYANHFKTILPLFRAYLKAREMRWVSLVLCLFFLVGLPSCWAAHDAMMHALQTLETHIYGWNKQWQALARALERNNNDYRHYFGIIIRVRPLETTDCDDDEKSSSLLLKQDDNDALCNCCLPDKTIICCPCFFSKNVNNVWQQKYASSVKYQGLVLEIMQEKRLT